MEHKDEMYNRVAAEDFRRVLREGVLLAQGPLGTALISEAGDDGIPAAYWNVSEPSVVERIHAMHALAGANVLITNTFQASGPALERDSVRQSVASVNRAAMDCARTACIPYILGSIGPCGLFWLSEDSREFREARAVYREQAESLLSAGATGLLLETFTSIRDLQPALAGAVDAAMGMPVLVSFAIDEGGALLGDGLNIEAAVMYAEKAGCDAVGVNCCDLWCANDVVKRMRKATSLPLMVRPHAGEGYRSEDGVLCWCEDQDAFATESVKWRDSGATLVGACCGATPLTTVAMADALGLFE